MKRQLIIAITIILASTLFADPAVKGWYADQSFQASYNALGAQLGTKLFYRIPLVKKEGILWESTKVDVGIMNDLSPAYDFPGAFIDIEPIAVFDLELKALFTGYYSALGFGFHEIAGYGSDFSQSAQAALPSKSTTGYFLTAAPTLKFALGHFAFSDTLHIDYFNVDGGSGYFYEAIANCPLAKSDFELNNDAYALYKVSPTIYAGLNDSILLVPASGYRSQILQAVGAFAKPLSDKLSFYAALTAGIYLEDRYLKYAFHAGGETGITYAF
jgi:hypothetical protein